MSERVELTDDQKAQIPAWRAKWVEIATSCAETTETEQGLADTHLRALYRAVNLEEPLNIAWTASPLAAAIAGSCAAAVWDDENRDLRPRPERRGRLLKAPDGYDGVVRAAWQATMDALDGHVRRDEMSRAAWTAAVYCCRAASGKTVSLSGDIHDLAARAMVDRFRGYYQMMDGGNYWPGWPAFISFFRQVVKLDLDEFEKWQHYEFLATLGPRMVHEQFAVFSDRFLAFRIDEEERPHADGEPSHEWRDGWELYYWHGVLMPKRFIVADPAEITAAEIMAERNTEVRRAVLERVGRDRLLDHPSCRLVQRTAKGALWQIDLNDDEGRPAKLLDLTCPSTGRRYVERQPPQVKTVEEALLWRMGEEDLSGRYELHAES